MGVSGRKWEIVGGSGEVENAQAPLCSTLEKHLCSTNCQSFLRIITVGIWIVIVRGSGEVKVVLGSIQNHQIWIVIVRGSDSTQEKPLYMPPLCNHQWILSIWESSELDSDSSPHTKSDSDSGGKEVVRLSLTPPKRNASLPPRCNHQSILSIRESSELLAGLKRQIVVGSFSFNQQSRKD